MKMTKMGIGNFMALIILVALFLFSDTKATYETQSQQLISQKGSGTAIIMTGAAARIPQQAALLEELYNRGLLKDVVFISGVSAGALNAVMLNAILSGKLTWDDYRDILFKLRNNDIFTVEEERKLPVNTEPVRKLLKQIVEDRLGYHQIGDLPYMTEISFNSRGDFGSGRRVYRMCSRKINKETDTTLSLVDIMMATSAIPFAFPPVRIENVTTIPDHEYVDGGVGSDYIPFKALLDFQKHRGVNVEKVYIISKKSGNYSEISQELDFLGIDNDGHIDRFASSLDKIMSRILINRLGAFARQAPEMIYRSYVWIPDFEQDFMMFNFNNLEEQYTLTRAWAQNNDPVPLGDFLLYNRLKRRK
jgi:predicted acylesterase/phospholipase RssA